MFSAIIRMMDVPTALAALKMHMDKSNNGRGITRGGALLIFACCLVMLGPLTYLWWRFDLSSTWNWFDWLLTGGSEDVKAASTAAGADDQTAAIALFIFGTGFTLLPSAVQLGLSRFVSIPGLGFLVKVSLGFDLITDFPAMWTLASNNPWYEHSFRWWPLVALARLLGSVLGTIICSFVIQSAVILLVAVLIAMVGIIVMGDRRSVAMLAD